MTKESTHFKIQSTQLNKIPISSIKPELNSLKKHKHIQKKTAEKKYRQQLNQLIQKHKIYPKKARRRGQQGTIRIAFVIRKNGKIADITIIKATPSRSLNTAAKKLITNLSGLLPFGSDINRQQWAFELDIQYQLN